MRFRINPRWLLAVFSVCFLVGAGLVKAEGPAEDRILPMEVVVNGVKSGAWLMVERAGVLYAPREAFEEWRVTLRPGVSRIVFRGNDYFSVTGIEGFNARMDLSTLTLDLSFSPEVFAATRLKSAAAVRAKPSPVLPSAFLNYDLNYLQFAPRDAESYGDLGMVSELGFSGRWGVLTQTVVGRNLTRDPANPVDASWVRLETTLTMDWPDSGYTMRLGDSSTRPSMWGRRVYFGGAQIGTNFALMPGFISQPLPVLSGLSTAPSTVELYINGVLGNTSNVPPGPFVIDNFPQLTGSGEVRLVVRDLLGRESVVTLPFFTSSQLLKSGLNDWSLEAGSLRNGLGVESNDYGPRFMVGTFRHGYSNEMTLEGRLENTPDLTVFGGGTVFKLPWQLLGKLGAAGSRESSLGNGHFALLGLERQILRFGAAVEVQGASEDFRQVGQDVSASPTRWQIASNMYYATPGSASMGFGVASFRRYDDTRLTTVSLNYSTRVAKYGTLSAFATSAVNGATGNSVGLVFTTPLDGNRFVSATANRRDGKNDYYVTATQNVGPQQNLGWRVMTGTLQDESHTEGGASYLGRYGQAYGEFSTTSNQNVVRAGANGGLVIADGNLFATRRVDQSFAVAEVPGYGDIGIGLNTNMMTRTDRDGVALIPNLAPYQANSIRVNPQELPINAQLDSIEQTTVPSWRSGVKVVFPVRSGRGALIRIELANGQPAPPGAVVMIEGDKEEFYVARRGEAFVTGLQAANKLTMSWDNRQCRFNVALPSEVPDEFPRIGPVTCLEGSP